MLTSDLDGSLMIILWPLIFYIPILIWTSKTKENFYTYLSIAILQAIIATLILMPSPSGNGSDMIGYGAVVILIFGMQIFSIVLCLIILLVTFFMKRSKKKRGD